MQITAATLPEHLARANDPLATLTLSGQFHEVNNFGHADISVHSNARHFHRIGELILRQRDGSIIYDSMCWNTQDAIELIVGPVFRAFKRPGYSSILAVQLGAEISYYRFVNGTWWLLSHGARALTEAPSYFARKFTKATQYSSARYVARPSSDDFGFTFGPISFEDATGAVFYRDIRIPLDVQIDLHEYDVKLARIPGNEFVIAQLPGDTYRRHFRYDAGAWLYYELVPPRVFGIHTIKNVLLDLIRITP